MQIAISGTHFIGKTTFVQDFINRYPHYKYETEPYYKLQDDDQSILLEPSLDSFIVQLKYSINQLNESANVENIIFDRCPVDFVAYAMCALEEEYIDIHDSEVSLMFPEIKAALNNLDLIVFLPINKENNIKYTEEDPSYRLAADECFKKIYQADILDIFPRHNHPIIIELSGNRTSRLDKLENYIREF